MSQLTKKGIQLRLDPRSTKAAQVIEELVKMVGKFREVAGRSEHLG
jgi:hypothetical protein